MISTVLIHTWSGKIERLPLGRPVRGYDDVGPDQGPPNVIPTTTSRNQVTTFALSGAPGHRNSGSLRARITAHRRHCRCRRYSRPKGRAHLGLKAAAGVLLTIFGLDLWVLWFRLHNIRCDRPLAIQKLEADK